MISFVKLVALFFYAILAFPATRIYVCGLVVLHGMYLSSTPMPGNLDVALDLILRFGGQLAWYAMMGIGCWMLSLCLGAWYYLWRAGTAASLEKRLWRLRVKAHAMFPDSKSRLMTPQMGLGTASSMAHLARAAGFAGVDLDADLVDKIENALLLWASLREAQSTSQFCSIFGLYLKTHYRKSVVIAASTYLAEMLNTTFDPQMGEFGNLEHEQPQWLKMLKECQVNWRLAYNNPGISKVSNIISLCLALGLCESKDLKFEIAGMKLFSIGAAAKHSNACDLMDAVMDTVVYFAEGGYVCFLKGSIKPLLYGGLDEQEFEENYLKCMKGIDLARSGNLEKFENMSENDFDALLDNTKLMAKTLKDGARGSLEKGFLQRKIEQLTMWKNQFIQFRVQGGLRIAPYSIGVFGSTSIGKSSIANILMVTTLLANDYAATDDRIITLNERDKFWSNYRSYINGVLNDDVGNTKPEFVDSPPSAMKLQIVNNVRVYANMAEADQKGKVSVEPKVYIETKNVKDGLATVFSNEPCSITRRDRITLTCKVREQYARHNMLDFDKVIRKYGSVEAIPFIPDLWEITVERSFPVKAEAAGQHDLIGWERVIWNGKELQDISIHELIRFITEDSKKYFKQQEFTVKNGSELARKIEICKHCKNPIPDVCQCVHTPPENPEDFLGLEPETPKYDVQFGVKIAKFFKKKSRYVSEWLAKTKDFWDGEGEDMILSEMIKRLTWLQDSPFCIWTNWVPTHWLRNKYLEPLVFWSHEDTLRAQVRSAYFNHISVVLLFVFLALIGHPLLFLGSLPSICSLSSVVEHEKKVLLDHLAKENKAMPLVFKKYRDEHAKWICGSVAVIGVLYAIACVWKEFKAMPDPQATLSPTSDKDVKERDAETNPWAGVKVSPMPCSEKSKTTALDRLESMAFDNTCYFDFKVPINGKEKHYHLNAFFPCSNVALVPQHIWVADSLKANFVRHDASLIGGNFSCYLSRNHSIDIPDTDLSLVWVPNGGDWKDLSEYLPTDVFNSVPARLLYKQEDGTMRKSKLMTSDATTINTHLSSYKGAEYKLEFPTFEGLCMAPIITETKGPAIGGFHLSGHSGTVEGAMGFLTQQQLKASMDQLKSRSGVILSKSSGTMPTKLYDVQFFQGTDVHPKSPINFLPPGTNCKYYGQCTGRATYHSDVEDSVISGFVDEICGVPQQWGGPKFKKNYPWQASLAHSTKPSIGMPGELLERAVEDYKKDLITAMAQFPELVADIRPLTEMETVCGIDGKRFLDKMPPSTSVGYPLSGPKSKFLTYLDPLDHPSHQCPAELDSRFWKLAYEMEEMYVRGERAYPIFKACLKDEPTKLSKDKVRVFQGAPIALQLLVRKYFLPVARFLSMLPLISECAVGINSQGPEWNELALHIRKFGLDRILAGDYSKYDLRMPAQVMFAAFRILIDIARVTGNYSERDVLVMEGIATDICYPLMAYNGDLIQHFGSNPSGQNLTVYINSIVNSLLFRCAFYEIYPEESSFREIVSLITYGDDAKSSVKKGYDKFNHIALADFLQKHDMVFTMPDKESDPTPYMNDHEADLLKRANVYSHELGVITGALDESSLFKSLHANLKSKALTREQQAMQNIDGSLREFFFHGRAKYEQRRAELRRVAESADIAHGCRELDVTYEDAVERWKEKYCKGKSKRD